MEMTNLKAITNREVYISLLIIKNKSISLLLVKRFSGDNVYDWKTGKRRFLYSVRDKKKMQTRSGVGEGDYEKQKHSVTCSDAIPTKHYLVLVVWRSD